MAQILGELFSSQTLLLILSLLQNDTFISFWLLLLFALLCTNSVCLDSVSKLELLRTDDPTA